MLRKADAKVLRRGTAKDGLGRRVSSGGMVVVGSPKARTKNPWEHLVTVKESEIRKAKP